MFYKRWLQFEHLSENFHMDQLSSHRSSLLPPCHSLPTMTSDATWSWSSSWSDQSFKVPRIGEFLELIVRWEFRLINFIQLQCTNIKSSIISIIFDSNIDCEAAYFISFFYNEQIYFPKQQFIFVLVYQCMCM